MKIPLGDLETVLDGEAVVNLAVGNESSLQSEEINGGENCHTAISNFEDLSVSVFENRVLRRRFGPNRDEVTWEWRKPHNEELHDLYSLPTTVRVIKSI
jgi:hypothetical protein